MKHNFNAMLDNLQTLVENPNPRIPVVLCLDTSYSMKGQPIRDLNHGVAQFVQEMKADALTRCAVEVGVVTFNSQATCIADFTSVDNLSLPTLEADENTAMGEGVSMALDMLDKRKQSYRATGVEYYQPILVVMSDGEPNGNPKILKRSIARIGQLVGERRLTAVSVGIGNDANMTEMHKLSPARPAAQLSSVQFREFFAWLSQSVSSVSHSMPEENATVDYSALMDLSAEPWPEECL